MWFVAGAIYILAPAAFSEPTPVAPPRTPSALDLETERLRASLPKGPATVKVEKGLVSLTADKAWKITILQELGKQIGFEAIGGGASNEPITMTLERVPLEEAIRKVAGSDGYWLGYEYDAAAKAQALKHVIVGPRGLRAANVMRMRRMAKTAKEKQDAKRAEAAENAGKRKERMEQQGLDPLSRPNAP